MPPIAILLIVPAVVGAIVTAPDGDNVTLVDAVKVVNAPVDAVVAPIVVPLIEPPVIVTELALCVDIVPRPVMAVLGIVEDAVKAPVPLPIK